MGITLHGPEGQGFLEGRSLSAKGRTRTSGPTLVLVVAKFTSTLIQIRWLRNPALSSLTFVHAVHATQQFLELRALGKRLEGASEAAARGGA